MKCQCLQYECEYCVEWLVDMFGVVDIIEGEE